MAENERRTVDPNAADTEALSKLPGIGPTMARRIIEARPFDRAEDLTRVRGIGPSTLARLQPRLSFPDSNGEEGRPEAGEGAESVEAKAPERRESYEVPPSPEKAAREPTEAEQAPEEAGEPQVSAASLEQVSGLGAPLGPSLQRPETPEAKAPPPGSETAVVAEAEEVEAATDRPDEPSTVAEVKETEAHVAQPSEGKVPQPARRAWVLWTVAGSALLVLILSLALSLGILASINGGRLLFASPAELQAMGVRVDGLEARSGELNQEVQGLRTRLDNVEAFGGRIDALEGTAQGLRTDLDDTTAQVESLSGEIDSLNSEIDSLGQELADLQTAVTALDSDVQALQDQNARTQTFLGGLRDLLNELFAPEGGAK